MTQASSAIDLQSATTEIAENIRQVSAGIKDVNVNIIESSQVSGQVASEINDVLTESRTISKFSASVRNKAEELEAVFVQPGRMTCQFKA